MKEQTIVVRDGQEFIVETTYTPVRPTIMQEVEEKKQSFTTPDDDSQFTQLDPSEHGFANTNEKVPVEEKFDITQSDNVEVLRIQAKYHLEQSLACLERIDELGEDDED